MHIINAMFGRKLGGIERSFVDYCRALLAREHKVTAIIYPNAPVKAELLRYSVNIVEVKNIGQWDIFAKLYLRKVINQANPDAVILHGNRAVRLMRSACSGVPVIGVTHNYSFKSLIGLDMIFATTEQLKLEVISAGQPHQHVTVVPNMVDVSEKALKPLSFNRPLVIGTMGRFVKKKGFDVFVDAVSILNQQDISVKASIGGDGAEAKELKKKVHQLELQYKIKFPGWIDDKEQFFNKIDIFCLPSLHEPFGIILLEAFAHVKPVVTTDAEGPSEIAKQNDNSLVVLKGDAKAMADAISVLMNNQAKSHELARNAYFTAKEYCIEKISYKIDDSLRKLVPLQL